LSETRADLEPAIPFGAFEPDPAGVEDIEVMSDEIAGSFVAAEPADSAGPMGSAATSEPAHPPEPRARPGRVVVAIATTGAGSRAADDAEQLVEQLLDKLAGIAGVPADVHPGRGHEHRPPDDLVYWAGVDASRGRLATALDIVVCTHFVGTSEAAYVVTVDAPLPRLGALVSAAGAVAGARRSVLLTSDGPVTTEPESSVVVHAAVGHAQRVAGRAEVFPGQQLLTDDVPVAEVLDRTSIDQVRSTHGGYRPDAVLRAYGFVRPSYDAGALVLTVGHDDPLVVTPWEVRYCRPCCGLDH
jgi:hypothetical protein